MIASDRSDGFRARGPATEKAGGGKYRLRTFIMGDPPRRLARRWAWATFGTPLPPRYLALYDMNRQTKARLDAFTAKVRRELARL